MKKILARLFVLFALLTAPAFASQNSTTLPTTSPYPGLTMLNNINSAFNSFQTNFSGATAPSTTTSYQWWADTTTNTLKFTPDGTNFYPTGYFSGGWVAMSNGFKQVAVASTGSSNHYIVTYSPAPVAWVTGQKYTFVTNFANTGAADVNINSLGAKPLKKQGNVSLASGDISNGAVVECVYDGTNCQITSELSQASTGTVTSIATNNGITGGTITSSGTIGLASIADQTFLANTSGSSAPPVATSISAIASIKGFQVFTSSGTYTPDAGTTKVLIFSVGGGGGGGGSGDGTPGSSGGTTCLSTGASCTGTIITQCSGGSGGGGDFVGGSLGGAGGSCPTATLSLTGSMGAPGMQPASGVTFLGGGNGGPGLFGAGAGAGTPQNVGNSAAPNTGAGGGGGPGYTGNYKSAGGGGAGGIGVTYATGISGTYSVAIGSGGSHGGGGASVGGDGGSGIIFMIEF